VAVSMFTAITVTRTLLRLFVGSSIAQKTALFTTIGGK
jgi:preprotein translocase subunit SecD